MRRTEFRARGGGRVHNGAIRDRQNGNPGEHQLARWAVAKTHRLYFLRDLEVGNILLGAGSDEASMRY